MGLLGFLFLLPLLWMISSSFKRPMAVFEYPFHWIPLDPQWSNYADVWMDKTIPFPKLFYNSLKISFWSIVGEISISSLAAYAFAKMRFKGKNVVFFLLLASMMIPSQVTIIPRFILFKWLGLYNNHWSVIIPSWFSVTAIFLLRQFFQSIPDDLVNAAKIDGSGHLRIWAVIMVPLTRSALISLVILTFIGTWNDFMSPLIFLVRKELYTVSLGINWYYTSEEQQFNLTMAAATSAVVPILLLFVFCQKYFIEGIVTSGLKG